MSDNLKFKIAIILKDYIDVSVGGETAIYLNLLSYLQEKGHVADVFCENNNAVLTSHNVYSEFSKNYENYVKLLKNNNYDCILADRNALKYHDLNCDIYLLHAHSKNLYHRVKYEKLFNLIRFIKKQINREIEALNNHKNSLFIFCSKRLEDDYCSLADLKNTKIIYPYSNYEPSKNFSKTQNLVYTFGISALGFQNKGGYLALLSAFLLKLSGKKFRIRIIYKKEPGILQSLLVDLLGLNDETEFLLTQRYMHDFYKSLDCLLVPSQLESFGMVAIEALSYNLPVIISDTCGAVEVLKENKNAFIFKFDKHKILNLYREMKRVMEVQDFSDADSSSIMTKEAYNKQIEEIISACCRLKR